MDVRSNNMSAQQKGAFKIAAEKFSAKLIIEGGHFHIQFK